MAAPAKLTIATVLASLTSLAAVSSPPRQDGLVEYSQDTSLVTCFDEEWKLAKSRIVRTPLLVSPDGQYRAYAEVTALIDQKEPWHCFNATTLYMKGPDDNYFRLVYDEMGTNWLRGNSIQLIDWTPDNRFLVTEIRHWQYFSDVAFSVVFLYDRGNDSTKILNQHEIFARLHGEACVMEGEVVGISEEGNIVFAIPPSLEKTLKESEIFMNLPCVMEGTWGLNPVTEKIERISDDYSPRRFGSFEPDTANK